MLTPTLNLPTITQEVALNTIRFNRAFGEFESRIIRIGRQMSSLGISLSLAVSIPLQLIGGVVIKTFADLDQAVTKAFSRIGGAGAGVKEAMRQASIEMSKVSKFTATQAAEGLDELVKAGLSAKDAIAALPIAQNLATAGDLEMGKSVEYLMDVMSAMRLRTGDTTKDMATMAKISDVLTFAANETTASVESMAQAFTRKAATASAMAGKSIESTAAVLMAYHQVGIKSALAGERFNNAMRDWQIQANKEPEVWNRIVPIYEQGTGKLRDFSDVLADLSYKLAKASDQEKQQMLMMLKIPSRSREATQALIGMGDQIKEWEERLKSAGGTTQQVADTQMQAFTNQLKVIRNHVTAVALDIGATLAPSILELMGKIKELTRAWYTLSQEQKKQIIFWTTIVMAAGPFLIFAGILIRAIGTIISVFLLLTTTIIQWSFTAIGSILNVSLAFTRYVMAFITGSAAVKLAMFDTMVIYIRTGVAAVISWMAQLAPIALIMAAVAGVIYLIVGSDGLAEAFEGMKVWAGDAFSWIKEKGGDAIGFIQNKIEGMVGDFNGLGDIMMAPTKFATSIGAPASISAMGTVPGIGGVGGALMTMSASQFEGTIAAGMAMGLDMSKFDTSSFTPPNMEGGEFDKSLLEKEPEKSSAGGQREGFSALERGTEEEYRARIKGQQSVMTVASKQLEEQKKANIKLGQQTQALNFMANKMEEMVRNSTILRAAAI